MACGRGHARVLVDAGIGAHEGEDLLRRCGHLAAVDHGLDLLADRVREADRRRRHNSTTAKTESEDVPHTHARGERGWGRYRCGTSESSATSDRRVETSVPSVASAKHVSGAVGAKATTATHSTRSRTGQGQRSLMPTGPAASGGVPAWTPAASPSVVSPTCGRSGAPSSRSRSHRRAVPSRPPEASSSGCSGDHEICRGPRKRATRQADPNGVASGGPCDRPLHTPSVLSFSYRGDGALVTPQLAHRAGEAARVPHPYHAVVPYRSRGTRR